jgi:hypothetical protein
MKNFLQYLEQYLTSKSSIQINRYLAVNSLHIESYVEKLRLSKFIDSCLNDKKIPEDIYKFSEAEFTQPQFFNI